MKIAMEFLTELFLKNFWHGPDKEDTHDTELTYRIIASSDKDYLGVAPNSNLISLNVLNSKWKS